jgi:hypothetical protein
MRHYRGIEAGAFYHNDFQKDRLDLVENMTCYKMDGAKGAQESEHLDLHQGDIKENQTEQNDINGCASVTNELKCSTHVVENSFARISNHNGAVDSDNLLCKQERSSESSIASCLEMSRSINRPSLVFRPNFGLANSNSNNLLPSVNSLTGELNAAINAEFARRINERIKAAAIAREAYSLLQLQVNPLQVNPNLSTLQHQLLHRNPMSLSGAGNFFRERGILHGVDPRAAALSLVAAQGLWKPPPINFASLQRNYSLPPTNIQGAKTA